MATWMSLYNKLWYQIVRNKISGKVTKFGGKRAETIGVANTFVVGGAQCAPPWA